MLHIITQICFLVYCYVVYFWYGDLKMKNKNKGFTLVELLAVIVVLAVVITLASRSVFRVLHNTKEQTSFEMRENAKDAALTYSFTHMHLAKCSVAFSKEMYEDNNVSHLDNVANASCIGRVTIKDLKEEGLFEDKHGYCKENDVIVIYRYTDHFGNSEYKAYASDTTCAD